MFKKSRAVHALLSITVLVAVGYYVLNSPDLLEIIREVNRGSLFVLIIIIALAFLTNSLILKVLLYPFCLNLTVRECIGISSFTTMGNYLLSFGGGTFGKALYLKKKYDVPYPAFVALASVTTLINFELACIMGAGAIWAIGFDSSLPLESIFWTFVLSGIFLNFLFFLPATEVKSQKRIFRLFADILNAWNVIKSEKMLFKKISLLLFINYILIYAELIASYKAFSIDINAMDAFLLTGVTLFFSVVRITPANFGIYEGGIALSSKILGIGFGQGLLAAGLLSSMSILLALAMGTVLGPWLLKERNKVKRPAVY